MSSNEYLERHVTQRYNIVLPDQGGRFHAHLHSTGLDQEFISCIIRSFEGNSFSATEFERFPIELIVDYVQRTHALYLQKILPEIEQSIQLLHNYYDDSHPLLCQLHIFYQRYYNEISAHLNEEESKLLPYIAQLLKAKCVQSAFSEYVISCGQYSIEQFLMGHHDTEDELSEIRSTIRLYNPPPGNESLYRVLLLQLETFEQDLHVHARMEEDVLIPKAIDIEVWLDNRVQHLSQRN